MNSITEKSKKNNQKISENISFTFTNPKVVIPLLGILILAFLTYFHSLKNGFTNYDDDVLIIDNSLINSLAAGNIKNIFTSFINGMYHPMVTLSWALEYVLIGNGAMHFHLINLLFHLLNVWLVYRFVFLLFKKLNIAIVAALIFAVHPMISESVLWLSERKDLVCAAFMLGGLIHYVKYHEYNFGKKYLIITMIFFVFALFSKPAAIIFPLLLLVIDNFYGRKIIKNVINEKIPFFVLSVIFGIIAIIAARSVDGVNTLSGYSLIDRIFFISYAIVFYVFKLIIPVGLSAKHFYPAKLNFVLPIEYYFFFIVLIIMVIVLLKLKQHKKVVMTGILFYLSCISIILPIVPVGDSVVSERYSYFSYIGLLFIIGYFYNYYKDFLINKIYKIKLLMNGIIVFFVIIFCLSTWFRSLAWTDSISIWTDVIKKDSMSALAYTARGDYSSAINDYKSAIIDYSKAIQIDSTYSVAFNNRGYAWIKEKKYSSAETDLNKAVRLNPRFAKSFYNRSCLWIETGEYIKAISDCEKSIKLNPDFAYAYYNRGNAEYSLNDNDGALNDFDKAISIDSKVDVFYYYRGLVNVKLKKYDIAVNDFNTTISRSPAFIDAYYYKARCYYYQKKYELAIPDFNCVLTNNPVDFESIYLRGDCRLNTNDLNGAVADFSNVINLNNKYAPAYFSRAMANVSKGSKEGVCDDLHKAKEYGLELDNDFMAHYCK